MADLRPKTSNLRLARAERPDFKPKRPDLRSERPERPDLRPQGPDLRPERYNRVCKIIRNWHLLFLKTL